MAFDEWVADPLRLPIGDKVYAVPELSARGDAEYKRIVATAAKQDQEAAAQEDQALERLLLGEAVWDEMVADGVTGIALLRAAYAVKVDADFGREVAEAYWRTGDVEAAFTEVHGVVVPPEDPPRTTKSRPKKVAARG